MEWLTDVPASRAGDQEARARLVEYLTPFVHGVALAHAPFHRVTDAMPELLEAALAAAVRSADDAEAVVSAVRQTRHLAKQLDAAPRHLPERHPEAHAALERLRALPEAARERLLWRLVEGIPGVELAEVLRLEHAATRKELAQALSAAARLFDERSDPAAERWLWEFAGTPSPFVARLEMLFPALRYELLTSGSVFAGATQVDLPLVPPTVVGPNPFASANPTVPAKVLPVEARAALERRPPASRSTTPQPGAEHIPASPSLVTSDPTLSPHAAERLRARLRGVPEASDRPTLPHLTGPIEPLASGPRRRPPVRTVDRGRATTVEAPALAPEAREPSEEHAQTRPSLEAPLELRLGSLRPRWLVEHRAPPPFVLVVASALLLAAMASLGWYALP